MSTKKQIFSISMVKNEIDVIESFVRYHINIFEGMIFLDDGSTDKTVKILNFLKKEGLPISSLKMKMWNLILLKKLIKFY